jgi:hypothetical protein
MFRLFKILYEKENKLKGMKGETLKILRAVIAFSKANVIPMVRESFMRARLRLNPENLFAPVTMSPMKIHERIAHPEVPIEEFLGSEANAAPGQATGASRRRSAIPALSMFAITLHAYVQKVAGICPLCGHSEEKRLSEEQELGPDERRPDPSFQFSGRFDHLLRQSFSLELLFFSENDNFRALSCAISPRLGHLLLVKPERSARLAREHAMIFLCYL